MDRRAEYEELCAFHAWLGQLARHVDVHGLQRVQIGRDAQLSEQVRWVRTLWHSLGSPGLDTPPLVSMSEQNRRAR